jgi:hypothetical protein
MPNGDRVSDGFRSTGEGRCPVGIRAGADPACTSAVPRFRYFLQSIEMTVSNKRWRRSWDVGYPLGAEAAVDYALASPDRTVSP